MVSLLERRGASSSNCGVGDEGCKRCSCWYVQYVDAVKLFEEAKKIEKQLKLIEN